MRMRSRIRSLAESVAAQPEPKGFANLEDAQFVALALLRHVPPDLRAAVSATLDSGGYTADAITPWLVQPFAPWAGVACPDYLLPRALVAWLIDPPRPYWVGHACERCGLSAPIYNTWANDPNPPETVVVFEICPACGRRTSFAAAYQPIMESNTCD